MFGVCCLKVTMATIDCCIGCSALLNFASPVVLLLCNFSNLFCAFTSCFSGGGGAWCVWTALHCGFLCCSDAVPLALVHKLVWRGVHPAALKPQTTVTLSESTVTFLCFCLHPSDLLLPFVLLSLLCWVFCFTCWPVKQPLRYQGVGSIFVFVGPYFFNSRKRNRNE